MYICVYVTFSNQTDPNEIVDCVFLCAQQQCISFRLEGRKSGAVKYLDYNGLLKQRIRFPLTDKYLFSKDFILFLFHDISSLAIP